VLVGAHYDHLGIGPAVDGDSIYNGARDNAAGVAEVLTIAEALAHGGVKTKRSIVFAAFGAEEAGLVGSNALVERPFIPLRDLAAVINLDGANLFGRTRGVSARRGSILAGRSGGGPAERLAWRRTAGEGARTIYRSDHFPSCGPAFLPSHSSRVRSSSDDRRIARRLRRVDRDPIPSAAGSAGPWYVRWRGAGNPVRCGSLNSRRMPGAADVEPGLRVQDSGDNRLKSRP
jgi:hypothetical protein